MTTSTPRPLIPSPWEALVWAWRTLRTMTTALWLLFILAILTLLGTMLPQRGISETTLIQWRAGDAGPGVTITTWLDKLDLFGIFSSWYFLTITALLFVSLTGCLIPRISLYIRSLRAPLKAHANLARHPVHYTFALDPEVLGADPADMNTLLDDVEAIVRCPVNVWSERLRVQRVTTKDGISQLAIEGGYVREGGSLVFHISLYILLVGVFISTMYGFTGQVNIPVGDTFVDTPLGYTSTEQGALFTPEMYTGQRTKIDSFAVDYDPDLPFTPSEYRTNVTFSDTTGATQDAVIKVNEPQTFGGLTYYQRAFGFAPTITLYHDGEVIYRETIMLEAQGDMWVGRGKVSMGSDTSPQVGVEVTFLPDIEFKDGRPVARSPQAKNPRMLVSLYASPQLGLDKTVPVMQLPWREQDRSTQVMVLPTQRVNLEGETLQVSWDDLGYWTGLQVSAQRGRPALLVGGIFLLLGLVPSLYGYKRKYWVQQVGNRLEFAGYSRQRADIFERDCTVIAHRIGALAGVTMQDTSCQSGLPTMPTQTNG